jgi:PAS domain S-box-containing protein
MGATPADTRDRRTPRLLWSAAVVLALLLLQALPASRAQRASDLLQLVLAAAAAYCCCRTGLRETGLARPFFLLIGASMLLWALGQADFMLGATGGWPIVLQYLLFVSSAAPLVMACALRPDRPRPGATGFAADVGLVCVLALFVYAYFPLARLLLDAGDPYQSLSPVFYNPQRLLVLGLLLWLLRGSTGRWRRLYEQLAVAMAVFHGVGLLPNFAMFSGTYKPGLYDLPWALPFVWVALAASEWQPLPAAEAGTRAAAPGASEPGWKPARQGNVIALGAVALVPVLHQLATLFGTPEPALAELRGRITLGGILLVGGLYLARQLHTLRSAERRQQAREERFRALVENSADAIGVVDGGGSFRFVSASSERVTGYRPDQLLDRSPLELAHPDELETLRRTLAEVSGRPRAQAKGFVRYRHRDGSVRDGAIEAINRCDLPSVGGVVLHLRDVTEQRQAEVERGRSLSLLEATLESTADGVLVVDSHGRITSYNQKFAALWRIPEPVLVSRDRERMMAGVLDQLKEPERFLDKIRELYSQPESESFDTLRFRDGRIYERYSLPQRRLGEVVGRVWSFRDVTERARAEQEMARLVAILDATPDFVGTSDVGGRPLYVNRAGRRMVGLPDEGPLADRHIAEFHPPADAARVIEEAIPTALREGFWSGESRLKGGEVGEIPVLQVVLAHRSPRGEVEFLSTIARDISQRIRDEEELRRSHTMAALGSLVAGVAHEVRNPLFGISSTLDALQARFAGQDDHAEYVALFRQQLERLSGLMNDLLEYGKPTHLRIGAGRFEDVVSHAVEACSPLTRGAGVLIETRLAETLPSLRMDERRLTQAVRNLLENAVQLSPANGRVSLEAGLATDADGAWIRCSIEDQGPGFAPGDLQRLFEPFFTRRPGGTGLGLSIVHRIVSDHGGRIEARNRPGGGACFTLQLPVAASRGAA